MENNERVYDLPMTEESVQTAIENIPQADSSHPTDTEQTTPTVTGIDEVEVETESEQKAIDEENPLNAYSEKNLIQLMKQVGEMVKIMEANWESSRNEFLLTDTHMKLLYKYNEEHREEMPDYLTEEQKNDWDRFNGLNEITEEAVLEIFGEEHPIIGVTHSQTVDRIKDVTSEFFTWLSTLKEYRQIHDAYMELVELQEEQNIKQLILRTEAEEDPDKKIVLQKAIDTYYNRKHLDFLAEEMDENTIDRLVNVFNDKTKIAYWLNRSQDKLKQLKISTKIILEISQFEKRFLPEKYHKLSNILLLNFMQTVIYCSCGDKNDVNRNKAVCMVLGLDRIIRDTANVETRERVLNNIMKFEDQFMDKIKAPTEDEIKPEE